MFDFYLTPELQKRIKCLYSGTFKIFDVACHDGYRKFTCVGCPFPLHTNPRKSKKCVSRKVATASQLFKRLNSYSKQHPLYRALKEFGKIP
ncbi:Tn3 family transposase, partial [Undibacterium sp. GrIS 1.2]|uniref:Tn3 family transposase n=1 Tax=Undibacterium sp. GrIS 1.2 TaxID=3143933 RepID=UPI0033972DB6